jgi:hypothetical protein
MREVGMTPGDARVCSSTSPRPGRGLVGWFLRLVLVAGVCLPVLATGAARADEGPGTDSGGVPDPGSWGAAAPARSFGLGGLGFGSRNGDSGLLQESTQGFSLWPEFPEANGSGSPAIQWDLPLASPFRPAPSLGEPLRGVRNWTAPLGTKFLRGTLIITGIELASGVLLALAPRQFTKWDDNAVSRGSSNFRRAWTELPVWDGDVYFHNWFGHPYAGALYYNMMRSQGGTVLQSFGFAAFQSVMWEYLFEAVAEQPSIQDLITTPIMGAVVGELFHRWTVRILRKGHLNFGEKALVFFLNPSYVINNGYRAPE